ncbi:predicted protein [Uncinocarpus reesii 1704]|uniref:DUF7770 domain-containing protein n=1 Tax=Uncinocarpus reesii (strain UAMH 1704) TaxID=336963 RepID=C4JM80_UNCRE|nr:uncharacterized protein UREG_03938 [Uncinocarpus reesii 1704]EEP79092.1 predicted protein [Uncinocarpus reesii 1704]
MPGRWFGCRAAEAHSSSPPPSLRKLDRLNRCIFGDRKPAKAWLLVQRAPSELAKVFVVSDPKEPLNDETNFQLHSILTLLPTNLTTMEPPADDLIKYIPPSAKASLLPRKITSIEVVAHERLPDGGNHWAFYLHTIPPDAPSETATTAATDDQIIQLDVSPSYSIPSTVLPGGSKAFLILSTNPHSLSPFGTFTKRVPLTVRRKPDLPTVQELVHLLTVTQHRHRYEFDDHGRGCRFWVRDQIPFLLDEGVVTDEEQAELAREAVLLEFPDGKEFPITIGRYY